MRSSNSCLGLFPWLFSRFSFGWRRSGLSFACVQSKINLWRRCRKRSSKARHFLLLLWFLILRLKGDWILCSVRYHVNCRLYRPSSCDRSLCCRRSNIARDWSRGRILSSELSWCFGFIGGGLRCVRRDVLRLTRLPGFVFWRGSRCWLKTWFGVLAFVRLRGLTFRSDCTITHGRSRTKHPRWLLLWLRLLISWSTSFQSHFPWQLT